MGLAKRGVLFILSAGLLIGLLGVAFATSTYLTLGSPNMFKSALANSGFYGHFADNAISQAEASSGNTIGADKIAFSDPLVQQAAHAVLSSQYLQTQGSNIIDNNYAWLQGKQPQPSFKVDLASARQDFATRVGQAISTRLASLPACSVAQITKLQASATVDPLSIACWPAALSTQDEGTRITQEILQNSAFLNNSVITPQSVSSGQSQPYYQKFAKAPQIYQLATKAPYIWGGLILVVLVAILLLARPKRWGIRRIGVVFIMGGVLLMLNKLVADVVFGRLQKQAGSFSSSGAVQQSLMNFAHHLENRFVNIALYFGVAFLAAGLVLVLTVRFRRRKDQTKAAIEPFHLPAQTSSTAIDQPLESGGSSSQQPAQPERQTAPLLKTRNLKRESRPKPPRLIQ